MKRTEVGSRKGCLQDANNSYNNFLRDNQSVLMTCRDKDNFWTSLLQFILLGLLCFIHKRSKEEKAGGCGGGTKFNHPTLARFVAAVGLPLACHLHMPRAQDLFRLWISVCREWRRACWTQIRFRSKHLTKKNVIVILRVLWYCSCYCSLEVGAFPPSQTDRHTHTHTHTHIHRGKT